MNDDHVIRLIEKRYEDIRHVETEQHWFLASYAVVIAGVLAFLAQNGKQDNFVIGFGILLLVSVLGLVHALRATKVLYVVQRDANNIIISWADEATDKNIRTWRTRWQWPSMQKWQAEKKGWIRLLSWDFFNLVFFYVVAIGWITLLIPPWKRWLSKRELPSPPKFTTVELVP